jgi:hypothetical protein
VTVSFKISSNLILNTTHKMLQTNVNIKKKKKKKFLLLHIERPLRREDESVVCSAITHWLESSRIHNRTLHCILRLLQPGRPDATIHIPQEKGGPVIPPSNCSFYVVRIRWRYSNPPPRGSKAVAHGRTNIYRYSSYLTGNT